ncbi:HAMP domain-containing sensor histidine kinase [Klugiella xanthotipulae]|uniref:histidine kinase n=1 Tax=Klugiella xanthotipulae TaxID=244735 RepID=A0A543HZJ0_9MICO|nr:HAMP domain-containing sensor histidine kinase [Klugiella xanthotipulae]TQM63655.1 two-component system OmpR family sensor kinase [Klugiella xanthotipulae]
MPEQRLRIPRTPTTLRRKVVLAVVALVTASSVVIGVVSILALRDSLMSQLDTQVRSTAERAYGQVRGDGPAGILGLLNDQNETDARSILFGPATAEGTLALVNNNGTLTAGYLNDAGSISYPSTAQLTALATVPIDGSLTTVDLGPSLGEYRLLGAQHNSVVFIVGVPMSALNTTVSQLSLTVIIVAALGAAVVALIAAAFTRTAMRPLERVSAAAVRVSELELDRGSVDSFEPVSTEGVEPGSEVGRVVSAFNTMLDNVGTALVAREQSENKVRRFVADASHELRTPLASIRGYSELIRRMGGDTNPDVTHSLSRIESESIRMTALVEDLLLLARLDEGRELVRAEVDLNEIVVNVLADAHVTSPGHEWALGSPEEPVVVMGDQHRLHQVVTNLVANARTHTPTGTRVNVTLAVVGADAAHPVAEIVVADDGPGIPPERLDQLFERFVRGDESRARATGSTGLGLAIVRAIVQAHVGEVTVASTPGDTRFVVHLPMSDVAAAPATPPASPGV